MSIELLGIKSFFVMITRLQAMIAAFALHRMSQRAAVPNEAQGLFVAIPESSSVIAAALNPEAEWIPSGEEIAAENNPFHDNPYVN